MTVRRTGRWRGVVAVALFAGAVGVLAARAELLLAGVVGTAFAAYPRLTRAPSVELELERDVTDVTPRRGDEVEVTVRLRNVGDRTLPDLRIVDGVPPMLRVVEGTPRHGALLRPGDTTEFAYVVEADHGRHPFEPATVLARDVAGATEVETTVQDEDETTLAVRDPVPEVPLRDQTRQLTGRLVTDEGGSGIEFHRTREYQHGDPMSHIDWRRLARTGELTTVEYREERAPSVLLLVDARPSAYRASGDGEPHAVAHARAATEQLLAELGQLRDAVGVAALGRELCWLPPGTGTDHLLRARNLLATHPTLRTVPPAPEECGDPEEQLAELRRRLGSDVQVVLLSPLADEFAATAALTLEAAGHAVTVVTPDVTTTETTGGRLALLERDVRVRTLRDAGVRVVDWAPDEPLGTTLSRAGERWSA